MHQNLSNDMKLHRMASKLHQNPSKSIEIHQNSIKINQNPSKSINIHQNPLKYIKIRKIYPNLAKSTYSHPCLHAGCLGDILSPRQLASYGKGNKGGWGLHDERSKLATGEESPLPKT